LNPNHFSFLSATNTIKIKYRTYQKACAKWEEAYGEKATPKAETMHEKIKRYQKKG